jgi:Protein of unknown function (DUF2934)
VTQELEQRIRERAYELWAMSGYTHGRDAEHWCAAEREIVGAAHVPAAAKKKSAAKMPAGAIASARPRRSKAQALHS